MLNLIIAILVLPPLCAIAVLKGNFDNYQLLWLHRMTATGVGLCVAGILYSLNPAMRNLTTAGTMC